MGRKSRKHKNIQICSQIQAHPQDCEFKEFLFSRQPFSLLDFQQEAMYRYEEAFSSNSQQPVALTKTTERKCHYKNHNISNEHRSKEYNGHSLKTMNSIK